MFCEVFLVAQIRHLSYLFLIKASLATKCYKAFYWPLQYLYLQIVIPRVTFASLPFEIVLNNQTLILIDFSIFQTPQPCVTCASLRPISFCLE
jgi:hypothetical protein